MNELALFGGAGGGILGGLLLGWRTVCAVEINAYAASVLCARQNEGFLPPFPIWDDVRTFDGQPWRGIVDVVSGGFPCQDISAAGRGAGIGGERSGLWREMARIIGEVRPRFAFVENSPMLTSRGLDRVLGDLAEMGYDAEWGVLGAADVGAPHRRNRIWIIAYSVGNIVRLDTPEQKRRNEIERSGDKLAHVDCAPRVETGDAVSTNGNATVFAKEEESGGCGSDMAHAHGAGLAQWEGEPSDDETKFAATFGTRWWATEPDVGRMAHGVAARVDRLRALGEGQVPLVAATAWRVLTERMRKRG